MFPNGLLRMNRIQKFAIFYLAALLFLGWGIAIGKYNVFPYSILAGIKNFVVGDPAEINVSFVDRLMNDFAGKPTRNLKKWKPPEGRDYQQVTIPGASSSRGPARIYQNDRSMPGHRLVVGIFDFDEGLHGAILLDESGNVVHKWVLHELGLDWEVSHPETNKILLGVHPLSDGSLIFTFINGASIQRFDSSGNRVWATEGYFNHSVVPDGLGNVWSVGPGNFTGFSKIDIETGDVEQEVTFESIMKSNPELDILGIRQDDSNREWIDQGGGRWHPNDADPLLPELAEHFPQFSVGDLLISLRSLNLVFVVDPNSHEIKWWRVGLVRRQHDPDWQPDGSITIFDNNMHREPSRIVKVDPKDLSHKVIFDGTDENLYTRNSGNHQMLPNGNILMTVSQQGRVVEVTPDGEVAFEFLNTYDADEDTALPVMECIYLPEGFFDFKEF